MAKRKRIRLVKMTREEERAYIAALNYYDEEGLTEREVDKLAWADLQEEFPRLQGYDGPAE